MLKHTFSIILVGAYEPTSVCHQYLTTTRNRSKRLARQTGVKFAFQATFAETCRAADADTLPYRR